MPGPDYIPASDALFVLWAQSFSENLNLTPAAYMMSPAECAHVQTVVNDFIAALAVATNENTRTKPTILAKDNARSIAESLCRDYAVQIKTNLGISDEDKVRAGVRPINPDREPVDCPTTQPLLNILGNTPGVQTLVYADSTTPDSKKRPFGASELQLFMAVSATYDAPLSEARFVGKFTRNPIDIEFTEGDDGKVATFYGRWASVRGEVGPFSLPISMRIAA